MLPRIDGSSRRGRSTTIGGETDAPAPSRLGTAERPPATKQQLNVLVSQRLVEEARLNAANYSNQLAAISEELSHHPQLVAEQRQLQQRERRAKKLAVRRRMAPSNRLEYYPQPAFRDGGYSNAIFGLPPIAQKSRWQPVPKPDDDDDTPIALLKKALAKNFIRVVKLFKQWDVNCDGRVSTNELYDAIGALKLVDESIAHWGPETCRELFEALDTNKSGTIEMGELHDALRRYGPPPLESIDITTPREHARDAHAQSGGLPARRKHKPNPIDVEAVRLIKQQLAVNQTRVLDIFRRWDYDMDSSISEIELRRALAALSIPIEPKALKMLFRQIDVDGSGSITF